MRRPILNVECWCCFFAACVSFVAPLTCLRPVESFTRCTGACTWTLSSSLCSPQTCPSSPPGLSCGRCPPSRWSAVFLSILSNTWSASSPLRATPNCPPEPRSDHWDYVAFVVLRCFFELSALSTSFFFSPTHWLWVMERWGTTGTIAHGEKWNVLWIMSLRLGITWKTHDINDPEGRKGGAVREAALLTWPRFVGEKRVNLPSFGFWNESASNVILYTALLSLFRFLYVRFGMLLKCYFFLFQVL